MAFSNLGNELTGMAKATNTPLMLASIPELKIIYHNMIDKDN